MRPRLRAAAIGLTALFVAATATTNAQRSGTAASTAAPADVTASIVASAQALVGTLDDAERANVQFPFDGPQKARWSNLPTPMSQRTGLRMGDLSTKQRAAVMTLLSIALSPDGLRKVTEIISGDEVLRKNPAAAQHAAVRTVAEAPLLAANAAAAAAARLAEPSPSARTSTISRLLAHPR